MPDPWNFHDLLADCLGILRDSWAVPAININPLAARRLRVRSMPKGEGWRTGLFAEALQASLYLKRGWYPFVEEPLEATSSRYASSKVNAAGKSIAIKQEPGSFPDKGNLSNVEMLGEHWSWAYRLAK